MDTDSLYNIVRHSNPRLFKKKKKQKKHYNASTLIGATLPQTHAIKFGNFMEAVYKAIINTTSDKVEVVDHNRILTSDVLMGISDNLKPKQIDLLIRETANDQHNYHFLESKLNCELDSEKWVHTLRKIENVSNAISAHYNAHCTGRILTPWYKYEKDMPNQYRSDIVMFANEFFSLIGYNITEEEWYNNLRQLGQNYMRDVT
jgi:hypothetical protein